MNAAKLLIRKRFTARLLPVLLMLGIMHSETGCKKDLSVNLKPTLNVANDNLLVQRPFIAIFNMMVKAATDTALQNSHHAVIDGAEVTLDTTGKQYLFSFPGDLCPDSVFRYGGYMAVTDTGFFVEGSLTRIVFYGYAEDNHRITGSDTIINQGLAGGVKLVFRSQMSDVTVVKDSVRNIHWQGVHLFSVDQSVAWLGSVNAAVSIDGFGSGISSMNYAFNSSVTASLQENLSCPWIKTGTISFTMEEGDVKTGTIRFMAGQLCNNRVDYDFEGNLYYLWLNNDYLKN
jgi:hypothetical protein